MSVAMKPLEPPDSHFLRAAQGWLELGSPDEARVELARIDPALTEHPDVLEARWNVLAAERNWSLCVELASTLVRIAPRRAIGWIHRSYALHELKRTREAADLLLPAATAFPSDWLIRYNLACYACQMGKMQESWNWLQNAFELGEEKQIRQMALDDPDLEPLRSRIAKSKPPL